MFEMERVVGGTKYTTNAHGHTTTKCMVSIFPLPLSFTLFLFLFSLVVYRAVRANGMSVGTHQHHHIPCACYRWCTKTA